MHRCVAGLSDPAGVNIPNTSAVFACAENLFPDVRRSLSSSEDLAEAVGISAHAQGIQNDRAGERGGHIRGNAVPLQAWKCAFPPHSPRKAHNVHRGWRTNWPLQAPLSWK